MNNVLAFYERQIGNYSGRNYEPILSRLCVHDTDNWKGIAPSTNGLDYNPEPPIFAAKFANCPNHKNILALANEDGNIALHDTNARTTELSGDKSLAGQQCHHNAVFDLEWMPGRMKFVSASGDHTARLWDVNNDGFTGERLFNGHSRSVKTAAFRKNDSHVFATGGRDGAILIWDVRASLNVNAMPKADNCINNGHAGGPGTPHSHRKRTRQTPKLPPPNVTSSSITGLVFQDDNTLISCGAGDGIIKVWDLRRNYTTCKKEPLPKYSIHYPGSSTFKGYTNLLVDNSGLKLYVNCMDNNIYCYNLATYSSDPIIKYTGLRNGTFYIKSSLSPDGKYLLSGSSEEKAYIWNVNCSQPLLTLTGHTVEVTCVAWSQENETRIVTCSDDDRHKIWRIGPEVIDDDQKIYYRGHAEMCKEYKRNSLKIRLKSLENTPRTMKQLVHKNETTPSSIVNSKKRTYSELCNQSNNDAQDYQVSEQKRPYLENRGRRLFSPLRNNTTNNIEYISMQNLTAILEETEPIKAQSIDVGSKESNTSNFNTSDNIIRSPIKQNTNKLLLSPLTERLSLNLKSPETPTTMHRPSTSSAIFSPTSNLPNYVIDGEAPHLTAPSPKRKLKENVDWLTKIRKQKMMSTINSSLNQKLNGQSSTTSTSSSMLRSTDDGLELDNLLTSKLQSITPSAESINIPKRRPSRSGNYNDPSKTPTRRKTESTLLRFFKVTHCNNKS